MIKIITFISDTHTKHHMLDLPGGDVLVFGGDLMNSGYNENDINNFCKWFDAQDQYKTKIFIAGNHDRLFELDPERAKEIYSQYNNINYLEDSELSIQDIKVYGSPWQPEFCNWAFNLPKGGKELEDKWAAIPENLDILITHGPPQGILDVSGAPYNEPNLGCSLLRTRVDKVKPKIHIFGHIHGSAGYKYNNSTHFINASVLNERYEQNNLPLTVEWDSETNEIKFI